MLDDQIQIHIINGEYSNSHHLLSKFDSPQKKKKSKFEFFGLQFARKYQRKISCINSSVSLWDGIKQTRVKYINK